jgi:hypothetical protein
MLLPVLVENIEFFSPNLTVMLKYETPVCHRYNNSFSWIYGEVLFEKYNKNTTQHRGKIVITESPTFNATLMNKFVNMSLTLNPLAYVFVASATFDRPGKMCILHNTGQIYNNIAVFASITRADYNALMTNVNNQTKGTFWANLTSTDVNYFLEQHKYVWVLQLIYVLLYAIVISIAVYMLYVSYKIDKRFNFTISTVCLFDIVAVSIYQLIVIIIDPNYYYGIIDSRVGLTLLYIPFPIGVLNILLIAIYWEELLKKSTKIASFLVTYAKIYIIIVLLLLGTHIGLIIASLLVDFSIFTIVTNTLTASTIIPAIISIIYCIANSIRIILMIRKMDQKLINKNDRRKKLERTMLFIYVANFGLVLLVIGSGTNISPFFWNYKIFLNDIQYLFRQIGMIICHLGIMFSFHLTSSTNSSTGSRDSKNKKSVSSKISH